MMRPKVTIVRYSELFLKSDFVRNKLQKKLSDNIRNGMKTNGIEGKVTRQRGRIFIESDQIEELIDLLRHIFGISSFSPSFKLKLKELEEFVRNNSDKLVKGSSFAVRVKRTGEHNFTSQEFEAKLGQVVVNKTRKKVDLEEPETELGAEVRSEDSYVFTQRIDGPGGMPLGSQGKVNCYVDSRESLIAAWLMMKRGCITRVYHDFPPEILDKWCYGTTLEKIKVKNADEIDDNLPLVVGFNLEKNGIGKLDEYNKKFSTVLTPIIAFKEDEIEEYWQKINK